MAWNPFRRERWTAKSLHELAGRLHGHVDVLAGLIGPRHLGKPNAHEAAATYVERQLAAIGDEVGREEYEVDVRDTSYTVANLVVERVGTDRPHEIVIVGAHYDTVWATPGADDNASAVAMLIEVARLLAGKSFRRTVRFVSFPCEEMPYFHSSLMGSQQYARGCRERGEQVVGMLCLEMVGFYSTEKGSQKLPPSIPRMFRGLFPRRGDFLAAVGNLRSLRLLWSFTRGFRQVRSGLRLFSIALPEIVREIRMSDNSSFWDQGFAALMITDTSFLRNPHYHMPSDTPETLDYERMARGTIGVAGAVERLARRG